MQSVVHTASSPDASAIKPYNIEQSLRYVKRRELQMTCKHNGLRAIGKNVDMINRLAKHFSSSSCPTPSPQEVLDLPQTPITPHSATLYTASRRCRTSSRSRGVTFSPYHKVRIIKNCLAKTTHPVSRRHRREMHFNKDDDRGAKPIRRLAFEALASESVAAEGKQSKDFLLETNIPVCMSERLGVCETESRTTPNKYSVSVPGRISGLQSLPDGKNQNNESSVQWLWTRLWSFFD